MKPDEIPSWVPEAVRRMAALFGTGHEMVARFLSDPAMDRVWKYLNTRDIMDGFEPQLRHDLSLNGIDLGDQNTDEQNRAYALFFYTVLVSANNSRIVAYRATINEVVRQYEATIKQCSALSVLHHAEVIGIPDDDIAAINRVIDYCNKKIGFLAQSDNPSILERKGRRPSTDPMRACVREIATATYAIFGDCFYSINATIATVMFRPSEPVDSGTVEKWCTDPPLPIRKKAKREPSH